MPVDVQWITYTRDVTSKILQAQNACQMGRYTPPIKAALSLALLERSGAMGQY